jgi:hypothetical protein
MWKGLVSIAVALAARSGPPGALVNTYSLASSSFEIYLCTHRDEGALELHRRVEKLAVWFIEGECANGDPI